MSVAWTDTVTQIAGCKVHYSRAGSGRTVLVLHHDIGTPDRLPFYDALAEKFDVIVPHHPGWGKSERPQWLRHPRDIAADQEPPGRFRSGTEQFEAGFPGGAGLPWEDPSSGTTCPAAR